MSNISSQSLNRFLELYVDLKPNLNTMSRRQLVKHVMDRLGIKQTAAYDYANALMFLDEVCPQTSHNEAKEVVTLTEFLPEGLHLTPESEKLLPWVIPLLVKMLNWASSKYANPYLKKQGLDKHMSKLNELFTQVLDFNDDWSYKRLVEVLYEPPVIPDSQLTELLKLYPEFKLLTRSSAKRALRKKRLNPSFAPSIDADYEKRRRGKRA